MPALRATMSRSVLDKIDWYRTFCPLEIVFYSTCRIGTERSAVQTFRFHLARRRRMPAPAKSKAVATVKLNEIEDVKESQPASASQGYRPFDLGRLSASHTTAMKCVQGLIAGRIWSN